MSHSYEDYEDQLLEFISEEWVDDAVESWRDEVLGRAATPTWAMAARRLDAVLDAAGDASNYRDELWHMRDDDPEYFEFEESYERLTERARRLFKAFWEKYAQ